MLDISHLQKSFGSKEVVRDLSFAVRPGEVLGFLGPNGAGKSTSMRMITGFLRPDGGSVVIHGADIWKDPITAKKHIGYLPEGAPSYGDMTTLEFLHFMANIRQLGKGAHQAIDRVVGALQLSSVLHQTIDTLSKGFQRRVGLAQAILHDPKVLILDEPTDGLDPNQKHEVRKLIRAMSQDKIIVISTHILEEVSAVCTRAMIINQGQLKIDDTPQALLNRSETGQLDDVFRALTTSEAY